MSEASRHHDACTNCGAPLVGPYCPQCGQLDEPDRLTMHHVIHHVTHELFHLDGRVVSTLRVLLLKPGMLTREYLDGRRARYVPPLRLYLTCSVLYFLATPLLASFTQAHLPSSLVAADGTCRALHIQKTAFGFNVVPNAPGDTVAAADQDTTTFQGRLLVRARPVVCNPAPFMHDLYATLPKLLFLLVPLFALLMQVAFRNHGESYAAHFIFALHFHAALFLIMLASNVVGMSGDIAISAIAGIAALVYSSWQYYAGVRYAYRCGAWEATWKTTLVGLVYGTVYGAVVTALTLYTLMK